nr:ATP-dependent helicase C-terminal domain-containing protein [Micromonospora sp. DSM 115978]
LAAGVVVALAFPERLARSRTTSGSSYLMAAGTAAELAPGSALTGMPWLAVAVADRAPGRASARVRLAAVLDEATALEVGKTQLTTVDEVGWSAGELVSRRVDRLGAIVLATRPLARPDPALVAEGALDGLRAEGLGLLRWTPDAMALRDRMAFCHRLLGDPWPEVSDTALLESARTWLGPELARVRRRADLERVDAGQALRRRLPWPQASRFDELAPERVEVPSGSRVRLDYSAVGVAAGVGSDAEVGAAVGTGVTGVTGVTGPTLAVK